MPSGRWVESPGLPVPVRASSKPGCHPETLPDPEPGSPVPAQGTNVKPGAAAWPSPPPGSSDMLGGRRAGPGPGSTRSGPRHWLSPHGSSGGLEPPASPPGPHSPCLSHGGGGLPAQVQPWQAVILQVLRARPGTWAMPRKEQLRRFRKGERRVQGRPHPLSAPASPRVSASAGLPCSPPEPACCPAWGGPWGVPGKAELSPLQTGPPLCQRRLCSQLSPPPRFPTLMSTLRPADPSLARAPFPHDAPCSAGRTWGGPGSWS